MEKVKIRHLKSYDLSDVDLPLDIEFGNFHENGTLLNQTFYNYGLLPNLVRVRAYTGRKIQKKLLLYGLDDQSLNVLSKNQSKKEDCGWIPKDRIVSVESLLFNEDSGDLESECFGRLVRIEGGKYLEIPSGTSRFSLFGWNRRQGDKSEANFIFYNGKP